MARYCPEHVTQEDGSECEWEHCWAATGAWLAAGASGGTKTPTPVTFCSRAGKSPCQNGGLSDMIRGLMTMDLWGRCKYRADVPKADLRALLMRRSGALVALEIDMDSWPESNGDEYHSIGVICGGGTGPNKGQVKTMDPLSTATTGATWTASSPPPPSTTESTESCRAPSMPSSCCPRWRSRP